MGILSSFCFSGGDGGGGDGDFDDYDNYLKRMHFE